MSNQVNYKLADNKVEIRIMILSSFVVISNAELLII